jgi:hypothetical protein
MLAIPAPGAGAGIPGGAPVDGAPIVGTPGALLAARLARRSCLPPIAAGCSDGYDGCGPRRRVPRGLSSSCTSSCRAFEQGLRTGDPVWAVRLAAHLLMPGDATAATTTAGGQSQPFPTALSVADDEAATFPFEDAVGRSTRCPVAAHLLAALLEAGMPGRQTAGAAETTTAPGAGPLSSSSSQPQPPRLVPRSALAASFRQAVHRDPHPTLMVDICCDAVTGHGGGGTPAGDALLSALALVDPAALYVHGRTLDLGTDGFLRNDSRRALPFIEAAAVRGRHTGACNHLGWWHVIGVTDGEGEEQRPVVVADHKRAVELFRASIAADLPTASSNGEAGGCVAQVNLAVLTLYGMGVEQDPVEGMRLLLEIADIGNTIARTFACACLLGRCPETRVGKDLDAADRLLGLARAAQQRINNAPGYLRQTARQWGLGKEFGRVLLGAAEWLEAAEPEELVEWRRRVGDVS